MPKEELYPYELRLNRVDKEYKEEKVKLDTLFKEERALTIEMNRAGDNLFEEIVKLYGSLLSVIEKKLPKEENEVSSQDPTQNNKQQTPIIYILETYLTSYITYVIKGGLKKYPRTISSMLLMATAR